MSNMLLRASKQKMRKAALKNEKKESEYGQAMS